MSLLRVLAVAGQFTDPGGFDGSTGGIQALVVLGLPVLGLGVLAALYWRTRVEVRRRELEPPLYLLTFISAAGHAEARPQPLEADQEDLELDRGRRREISALRRRGTHLLVALGANAVVLWLAAAWFLREGRPLPSDFQGAQSFTTIERPPPAAPETLRSDLALSVPPERDPRPQAAAAAPSPVPAPPPPPAREPVREVSSSPNRTSPPVQERRPVVSTPAPSTPRLDTAVTATVVTADIPAAVPDSVRAAPPMPPRPDPVRVRANAERALDIAVRQVSRELNARRPIPASGEGDTALARLADWVRSQRPSVRTGAMADIAIDGAVGEAVLPVTLRWRDDFGVGKQRTIRFRIAVQRQEDDWVFTGAELLERFP